MSSLEHAIEIGSPGRSLATHRWFLKTLKFGNRSKRLSGFTRTISIVPLSFSGINLKSAPPECTHDDLKTKADAEDRALEITDHLELFNKSFFVPHNGQFVPSGKDENIGFKNRDKPYILLRNNTRIILRKHRFEAFFITRTITYDRDIHQTKEV